MATSVPSRFAVLSIDDDDFKPKKPPKTNPTNKSGQKNKSDKTKQQQPKKDEKKKQNKSKKKKASNDDQQWEQWKQKDSMAVEETYEQDMHQAILLSTLAYEKQVQVAAKIEKEKEQDSSKKSGKKSKKTTISLEEFNNRGSTQPQPVQALTLESKTKEDPAFFERVEKEVEEEIIKGKEKDILKARFSKIDDDITSAQLRVEVEKRDEIISQLRGEVETLKDELTQVKKRNKKLYEILSHGEMKDKASVLAEVAKLRDIRDELTSEVASLHAQLEQERSKTRASSADDKKTSKQTNKKRPASENA
ncbi:G kinase-anchoring protein 1-like [Prorops nasuta]|uniref:G kinase-anchoring protein 1-like n=1 Tax=Prorops nasuta TaxID=863751 RepID=UPI0034CE92DE